ncbi:hypothetical protein [Paenibacillus planticolens]|uniref:Uncharacterized protein n=1 Tax=Paenibacillus planticolens TaxID=2654976 RepID=A0ABX1ZY92_9BACL|nr:hypothetical protein [Paenibacillus planticolens]NOV04838.1 hypothetical protein [Paenibacillus planticolens]
MQEIKDRKFQFWFYRVSHGELLIRSPKSKENPKNIDIMFFDITYIELPRFLDEIMLDEATSEEILYYELDLFELPFEKLGLSIGVIEDDTDFR